MPLGMKVGLSPGDFMLYGDPAPFFPKKGRSPRFSTHVCFGQIAECIKMALDVQVGFGPGQIVLDGDPAPFLKKGAEPPIFGPSLLWPNGWMHQNATWYDGRPQPRRLCVRWRPSPLPKRGRWPRFSVHVYSGQTAGYIKMTLGMMVSLSPGDFVLDEDPAPSPLRPMSIVSKRLNGSRWHLAWRRALVQATLC